MSEPTRLLTRIIEAIERETEGLREDADFDIHASSLRKHRLLLDLHHLQPDRVAPERLEALRAALDSNAVELSARLEAAGRIAAIAIDVVRRDRRDGTYAVNETVGDRERFRP